MEIDIPKAHSNTVALQLQCSDRLNDADELHKLWRVLDKARGVLNDGDRLANAVWRIWHRANTNGGAVPLPSPLHDGSRAGGHGFGAGSDASIGSSRSGSSSLRPSSSLATTMSAGGPTGIASILRTVLETGGIDAFPSPKPKSALYSPSLDGSSRRRLSSETHVRFMQDRSPPKRSPLGPPSASPDPLSLGAPAVSPSDEDTATQSTEPAHHPAPRRPSRSAGIKAGGLRRNVSERAFGKAKLQRNSSSGTVPKVTSVVKPTRAASSTQLAPAEMTRSLSQDSSGSSARASTASLQSTSALRTMSSGGSLRNESASYEPRSVTHGFFLPEDADRARTQAAQQQPAWTSNSPQPQYAPPARPPTPPRSQQRPTVAAKKNTMFFVGSHSEDDAELSPGSHASNYKPRRPSRLSDGSMPAFEDTPVKPTVSLTQPTPGGQTPKVIEEVVLSDEKEAEDEEWSDEESSEEEEDRRTPLARSMPEPGDMFRKRAVPGPDSPVRRINSGLLTQIFNPTASFDRLSGALQQSKSAVTLPVSSGLNPPRPLPPRPANRLGGRPADVEMSDDSDDDEEEQQDEPKEDQAQADAEAKLAGAARAMAIQRAYFDHIPQSGAPQTPRTTRRHMLATELSESMRYNLLWERQTRKRALPEVRKSTLDAAAARERSVNGSSLHRSQSEADVAYDHPYRNAAAGFHQVGW